MLRPKEQGMVFSPVGHRHGVGITRRELVQVGYSGLLGLGLPSLLTGRTFAAADRRNGLSGTRRGRLSLSSSPALPATSTPLI
jgi:hypothetical protein